MARNYIGDVDRINYANTTGSAIASGAPVFPEGYAAGVALVGIASGATGPVQTRGTVRWTKQPALAIAQGARCFWDAANSRVTTTSGAFLGLAATAAAAGDAEVIVALNEGNAASSLTASSVTKIEAMVSGYWIPERVSASWPWTVPVVMSSPPTITNGVANASTAIIGSVRVSSFRTECFLVLGGPSKRGTGFPDYNGLRLGQYPQITSSCPTAVEFEFVTSDSTGRFEIDWKGANSGVRVCVGNALGQWEYATAGASRTVPGDGNGYLDLVTLGAAGTYRIRLEFTADTRFYGIRCLPSDTIRAVKRRPVRVMCVGTSMEEPTFSEAGTFFHADGWPIILSHLTGWDVWPAGSGGTGYLNPGSGRVKFRDRLANDVIPFAPDVVIWGSGPMNDWSYGSTTPAQLEAEALACYQMISAALPNCKQILLTGTWPAGITSIPVGYWQFVEAVERAAATAGIDVLDTLRQRVPDYLVAYGDGAWSSTTTASASSGASSISVASIPAYFAQANTGTDGWWVRIGSGASQCVRRVSSYSGTGPYSLSLANTLPATFASGTAVSLGAESYITGTGRQGATANDGNADVMTGNDGTHFTKQGHRHFATLVASLKARAYSLR